MICKKENLHLKIQNSKEHQWLPSLSARMWNKIRFVCPNSGILYAPVLLKVKTIYYQHAITTIGQVLQPSFVSLFNTTQMTFDYHRCDGGSGPHAYRTGFWQINCISFPIHNYMIEQICICMLAVTAIRARALK